MEGRWIFRAGWSYPSRYCPRTRAGRSGQQTRPFQEQVLYERFQDGRKKETRPTEGKKEIPVLKEINRLYYRSYTPVDNHTK